MGDSGQETQERGQETIDGKKDRRQETQERKQEAADR
jgi:hypothetical protein